MVSEFDLDVSYIAVFSNKKAECIKHHGLGLSSFSTQKEPVLY